MSNVHVYHSEKPLDRGLEEETAYESEKVFENCVKDGKRREEDDAKIASNLVRKWLLEHSYLIPGEVRIVSGVEAAGLGKEKSEQSYWNAYFTDENFKYTEAFWENEYRKQPVSTIIPDDPFHRFVLHFLRGWRQKLHAYIVDEEIPIAERAAVLKKQVQNFAFFSRKKPFGGLWKMYSKPNDLLQQALDAEGAKMPAHDSEGNPLRTISGSEVQVQADQNISPNAATPPKPDENDGKIYKFIKRFAERKLGPDKVHNKWTMVKSTFCQKSESTSVVHRCYAFSGSSDSQNELHNVPTEWWNQSGGQDAWDDGQKIKITDVDRSQFGRNLVLILFDALKPVVIEDFKKLAHHVAFDESNYAEAMVSESRRDISVLDYGEFYDYVMGVVNAYDENIKKVVSDMEQLLSYTHASYKNKQFAPDKKKIEENVSKKRDLICTFSDKCLKQLEKKLDELPNKFLDLVAKQLQESKCGEDNVIRLTLHELLKSKLDCFLNVKVKFVAMDADCIADGKQFCKLCARKVPFYSVLPQLLREIGSTGDDFDKLSPLFEHLLG
ncbi:Hypothetical predicted protein [Paramuricea clavata]|uniref:Uncharacterized protein n=1 Tax=Paramuricea clavata TaxID=317549 RepID=A0A6S7JYX7_PARCT|nr:Hypothetical predicted protein [Paramuricea clavata]